MTEKQDYAFQIAAELCRRFMTEVAAKGGYDSVPVVDDEIVVLTAIGVGRELLQIATVEQIEAIIKSLAQDSTWLSEAIEGKS